MHQVQPEKKLTFIRPHHIALYAKCPRKAFYTGLDEPKTLSLEASVLKNTIQTGYIHQAKYGEVFHFNWVRKICATQLTRHLKQQMSPDGSHRELENLLSRLSLWYNNIYLNGLSSPGLPNFPIYIPMSDSVSFRDDIDIVITTPDGPILADIVEIKKVDNLSKRILSNDIAMHARVRGFMKATDTVPIAYLRIGITKLTITHALLPLNEKILDKSRKMINFIIFAMANEVYYPSVSEQCNFCPFVSKCSLWA